MGKRCFIAFAAFVLAGSAGSVATAQEYHAPYRCVDACASVEHVSPTILQRIPVPNGYFDFRSLSAFNDGVLLSGPAGALYEFFPGSAAPALFVKPFPTTWKNIVAIDDRFLTAIRDNQIVWFFACRFSDRPPYSVPYAPLPQNTGCGGGFDVADVPAGESPELVPDRQGNIWYAVGSGEVFEFANHPGRARSVLPAGSAYAVFAGSDGLAYAALQNGSLARLSGNPGTATVAGNGVIRPTNDGKDPVSSLPARGRGLDGSLWASSWHSIYHEYPGGRIVRLRLFPLQMTISHPTMPQVLDLRVMSDGSALANTVAGLILVTPDDRVQKIDLPWTVNGFVVARDGTVWFASDYDSYLVHVALTPRRGGACWDDASTIHVWSLPEDRGTVRDVFVTSSGAITFRSTSPEGVRHVSVMSDGYTHDEPSLDGRAQSFRDALSIARADDGTTWLLEPPSDGPEPKLAIVGGTSGLSTARLEDAIDELQAGSDGNMYAHASDGSVYKVSRDGTPAVVTRNVGDRFAVDRDGRVWFVRRGELYHADRNGHVTTWPSAVATSAAIAFVASAPNGDIWFTKGAMLCVIRSSQQRCATFSRLLLNGPIYPQRDGSVWFSWGAYALAEFVPPPHWR